MRVIACMHGCRPACVDTLQCFHVVPRPQNCDPGMVMVAFFQILFLCISMFRSIEHSTKLSLSTCANLANTHTHTHTHVDVCQQHDERARKHTHAEIFHFPMCVASTKVTNKELLVIKELDCVHDHSVDVETSCCKRKI